MAIDPETTVRTRIKICGLTRPEDLDAAVAAGADAVGLVFVEGSPRCLGLSQAERLASRLPPFVTLVALFLNPEAAWVRTVLAALPTAVPQFHGDEPPAFCRAFGRPYLKAVPMGGGADPVAYARRYPDCAGLLLDGHPAGAMGGRGETFDWRAVPRLGAPVILAGGLTPENVAEAIAIARPYGVDVSSGVESAPGVKDPARMAAFAAAVRAADRARET